MFQNGHGKKTKSNDKLPADTGMSQPIKKPKIYPESGPDSAILPADKVVTKPAKKWVDKYFQPLEVPDQNAGVGNYKVTTINPTSIG